MIKLYILLYRVGQKNEFSFVKFYSLAANSSNAIRFFNFVDNFDVFLFSRFQIKQISGFLEILLMARKVSKKISWTELLI